MSGRVIEAYCAGDTIAFPGPGRKLRLARGWNIRVPELRMSSNRARNLFKRCVTQALNMLPEGGWTQFQWTVSNDFGDLFQDYSRAAANAPAPVQRLRNLKAIQLLEAAKAGELRRERVTMWLGEEVELKTHRKDFLADLLARPAGAGGNLAASFEAALAPIGATLHPLDRDGIFRAWHQTLNPTSNRTNLIAPPAPVFSLRDSCWSSELRGLGDRGFYFNGQYYAVRTLQGLPTATVPGIMDHLLTLPLSALSITVRVRRLPKKKVIEKLQAEFARVQRRLERRDDPVQKVTSDQLRDKLDQLARDQIVPLEIELIVVTHASTMEELRRRDELVKSAAARMSGAVLFEAALAATARNLFLKTLPGWLWSDDPGYVHYGESAYVADLLPLSSSFEAHLDGAEALFIGPYQNLIGVLNFVGEGKAEMPQNWIIVGLTGSGKSFLLCRFLIETASTFLYTALLEEGLSHREFTEAVGGEPIIITPDGPWTFNVFDSHGLPLSSFHRSAVTGAVCQMMRVRDDERGRELQSELSNHVGQVCHDFVSDWLRRQPEAERLGIARLALVADRMSRENSCSLTEAFLQLREQEGTAEGDQRLAAPTDAEVRAFATRHKETVLEVAYAFLPEYPTLSSLRDHLEMEGGRIESARHLATLLSPWCVGGLYGKNFDGQNTVRIEGSVTHLELGRIPESAKELKAVIGFVFLTVLLRPHLLKLSRQARKRIVLEEISRFLQIPGGEMLLLELFEQFRKFHVQCIIVCQQISQLGSGRLPIAVLGNTRGAFVFNPGNPVDLDLLAEHLPLSDAAKAMILRYSTPDQLRGQIYSEFCYLHRTAREPYCGTIRFVPVNDSETK